MPAGIVRTGGILAFVMILVVLVLGLLIGRMALGTLLSGSPGAREEVGWWAALMYVVCLPIGAFVLWTTRGLFIASGYRAANLPVAAVIALLAVNLIHILDSGYHPTISVMWAMGHVTFLGILSEVAPPAAALAWIWFSVCAVGFGWQTGCACGRQQASSIRSAWRCWPPPWCRCRSGTTGCPSSWSSMPRRCCWSAGPVTASG